MLSSLIRRAAALSALALAALAHPTTLRAQAATGTVRGRITEGTGGRGIPEVQVTITGTRIGALTNQNGEFTLAAVPTGARTVEARRIGYQPVERNVTVTAGESGEEFTVTVKRGSAFDQEVKVTFKTPDLIKIAPSSATYKATETDKKFVVSADAKAQAGDTAFAR